jgi:hypothetical protein
MTQHANTILAHAFNASTALLPNGKISRHIIPREEAPALESSVFQDTVVMHAIPCVTTAPGSLTYLDSDDNLCVFCMDSRDMLWNSLRRKRVERSPELTSGSERPSAFR